MSARPPASTKGCSCTKWRTSGNGHGIDPVWAAIGVFFESAASYANACQYDLCSGKRLGECNIEPQASLVADYWALKTGNYVPINNKNKNPALADYRSVIDELQKSGPPRSKLSETPF
jgi:hypothetical protein